MNGYVHFDRYINGQLGWYMGLKKILKKRSNGLIQICTFPIAMAAAARPIKPPFLVLGLLEPAKSSPKTFNTRFISEVLLCAMYSFTILCDIKLLTRISCNTTSSLYVWLLNDTCDIKTRNVNYFFAFTLSGAYNFLFV